MSSVTLGQGSVPPLLGMRSAAPPWHGSPWSVHQTGCAGLAQVCYHATFALSLAQQTLIEAGSCRLHAYHVFPILEYCSANCMFGISLTYVSALRKRRDI